MANVHAMNAFFEDCELIFNTINNMKTAADKYLQNLEKHDTDFKSLLKPQRFINCYPLILKEVNRRNAFNQYIAKNVLKQVEDFNSVISREKQERLAFLKTHGDVIP